MINLKEAFKSAKTPAEVRMAGTRIKEHIKAGKIKASEISLKNLAEATLGYEGLSALGSMGDVGEGQMLEGLKEAVDPVNLSAFTSITGELVINQGYEAYRQPEFIGDSLVTAESSREDKTREAGLSPIDDDVLIVKEGAEYPDTKFGEDYIDVPSSEKRGLKIGLTREMIFFDRTGKLVEMAQQIGEVLGRNKERRILQVVLGITNTFVRKGVARNTYVASADPRINLLPSTALVDWTTLDSVYQLFQNMGDDKVVADPISVVPNAILCCPVKEWSFNRILNATEVEHAASGITTKSKNPLSSKGIKLHSNIWVYNMLTTATTAKVAGAGLSATNAGGTFLIGDFKRAFRYRTLFPFALESANHDKDAFERDVLMQWRVSERGVPYVYAPWYVAKVQPQA